MQVCEGGWERVHARRWGVGSMAAARPGGSFTDCPDLDPDMDPDIDPDRVLSDPILSTQTVM